MTLSNLVSVTQDPTTTPPPPAASITIAVVTPAPPSHLPPSGGPVAISGQSTGLAAGTTVYLYTSEDGGTTWTNSNLTATVASDGTFAFSWTAGANTGSTALTWEFEVSDNPSSPQ